MKSYLITGGAGFIGSHIAEILQNKKNDIRIIDNLSTGKLENINHIKKNITFIKGDIRDFNKLVEASKNCHAIFHQAAVVSVQQTINEPFESAAINDIGFINIMEAARQNKIKRVIFASSCAVYGDDPNLPKKENMIPLPKSHYAAQKLIGEHYAKIYYELYGIETVCLRYFNVFGPRQDPSSAYSGVISIFINKAISKESPIIYGDGKQYRDFIYVKDVVKANIQAETVENIGGMVFNIGTGKTISINKLWNKIKEITGINIDQKHALKRPGDILESKACTYKSNSILKFCPDFNFDKGLRNTIDWYKSKI